MVNGWFMLEVIILFVVWLKEEIAKIGQAEADISSKQRDEDLRLQRNEQGEQNSTLRRDVGNQPQQRLNYQGKK